MKCVICHGEQIQPQNVREELRGGNNVVYVMAQALVSQTCGERYYDRRAMQFLDGAERTLRAGQAQLQEVGRVFEFA